MTSSDHPVLERVLTGQPSAHDLEWLDWLWGLFELADLEELADVDGMTFEAAQDFKSVLALAMRYGAS